MNHTRVKERDEVGFSLSATQKSGGAWNIVVSGAVFGTSIGLRSQWCLWFVRVGSNQCSSGSVEVNLVPRIGERASTARSVNVTRKIDTPRKIRDPGEMFSQHLLPQI